MYGTPHNAQANGKKPWISCQGSKQGIYSMHSSSLEETDEILCIMRNVAQEQGEREIRHRSKRRKIAY